MFGYAMKTTARMLDGPLAGKLIELEENQSSCIVPMPSKALTQLNLRYVIYSHIGMHPNGVRVFSSRIMHAAPRTKSKHW
jgi:hypothetical protein